MVLLVRQFRVNFLHCTKENVTSGLLLIGVFRWFQFLPKPFTKCWNESIVNTYLFGIVTYQFGLYYQLGTSNSTAAFEKKTGLTYITIRVQWPVVAPVRIWIAMKRQCSSQFRVTVHTLLALDTFHSASFVLSLPLSGIFRQCIQPRLPCMVVPVRLIFLHILQTSSESIVSSTTTIHQHFLVWILRLDIYILDKISSEYLAVPRIDNRKFHNHIPYSTFHGIPVSVRRESSHEGW